MYGLLLIMCNWFNINSKSHTNTQQNEKLVDIDTHKVKKFQILASWFKLAVATNTNCSDFIGIHYINIIKNLNPKIPGFRYWKIDRDPGISDLWIKTLPATHFLLKL